MERGRWYYCWRCVLLHAEGEPCPKAEAEEGASEGGAPSAPAILGKTNDNQVRPDENDFAKEMRLSARAMEEAGLLTPRDREIIKDQINRYKDGPGKRFWRDKEIPFRIPRDLKRRKIFSGGF
jgi:hypothetical protein